MKYIFLTFFLLSLGIFCIFVPWYILFPSISLFIILILLSIRFEWGMYALSFLIPFSAISIGIIVRSAWDIVRSGRHTAVLSIAQPIIALSFFGLIINKLIKTKEFIPNNLLNFLTGVLLTFFAYTFLTLLWVPCIEHSIFQILILGTNLLLCGLLIYGITDEKIHKRIIWCCMLAGLLHGLIAISLYFASVESTTIIFEKQLWRNVIFHVWLPAGFESTSGFIRRGTAFAGSKEVALIMYMVFAFSLGLFLTETNRTRKRLLIAIMVFAIWMNLLSMSRGATVALLVMIFFFLIAIKRLRNRFFALSTIFLAGIILSFVLENAILNTLYQGKEVTPRLITMAKVGGGIEEQAPERITMWKKGFNKLKGTSYLGIGPGNFQYYRIGPHAHNIYLSFLFDFGLVGLGALLLMIIILFKQFFRMLKFQSSYLQIMCAISFGSLIAMGIHGVVDFEYNQPLLWFYLGMAVATLNLAQRELTSYK